MDKKAFYEKYAQIAIEQQIKYGIPASVTLAQMGFESSFGTSTLARECNNYFGIKKGGSWNGATRSFFDDHSYKEPFRVYTDVMASVEDHSKVLMASRYKACHVLSSTDYANWAKGIKAGGYASDPQYSQKIIAEIQKYGLDKIDQQAMLQAQQQGLRIGYMRDSKSSQPVSQSSMVQLSPLAGRWSLPIDFTNVKVSGDYGEARPNHKNGHQGIDISTKGQELPVYGTEDNGKVVFAGQANAAGNMIKVEYSRSDGSKFQTTYMHLSKIGVKVGDTVSAGQQIGVSGNTGRSTGPHLHFETHYMDSNGKYQAFNPVEYLAEMEVRGNISQPLDKNGKDALAQARSRLQLSVPAATPQQQQDDPNQALLANITNSNDPTKWLAYLMNNNGESSSGKDMFSELISTMFTAAMTLAVKLSSEENAGQQISQSDQKEGIEQKGDVVTRERETVSAKAMQQAASMNFDTEYPEEQQGRGLRQA